MNQSPGITDSIVEASAAAAGSPAGRPARESGSRVCYVVPGFCADESDWCIPVLRNVIAEMARRMRVSVYTPHYPYRRSSYRAFGADVHCFSDRKERGTRRLAVWRRLIDAVERDHAVAPFSVVHAFWANETGMLAVRIARRLGIPCVVTIGGGELARFPAERYGSRLSLVQSALVRHAFVGADVITAGSAWVAALAPNRFAGKLRVLPLGVDVEMFRAGPVRTGRRLLAASSMIALKDHGTLLRAFALARAEMPDLGLTIAGDGVERRAIEAHVRSLELERCVEFLGDVPHGSMPALFAGHDRLVHASLYESQGMVALEALATGLPPIVSNVGIAAELPPDLVYRFEPRDADALAGVIVASLATSEHAARVAADGPPLVARRYSVAGTADAFEDLYRSLMPARA